MAAGIRQGYDGENGDAGMTERYGETMKDGSGGRVSEVEKRDGGGNRVDAGMRCGAVAGGFSLLDGELKPVFIHQRRFWCSGPHDCRLALPVRNTLF